MTAHPYPALARLTIQAHFDGVEAPTTDHQLLQHEDRDLWAAQNGCFVSIKNADGSLRGCIGTFMPTTDSIYREIIQNAVSAATRDPRFPPMSKDELENARISVDVLSPPQQVQPGMKLDPKMYGVIVAKGDKRGLLLPDLEGVDTVEKQVGIAAQKAGIRDLNGAQLYRFTVCRYPENEDEARPDTAGQQSV